MADGEPSRKRLRTDEVPPAFAPLPADATVKLAAAQTARVQQFVEYVGPAHALCSDR